MLTLKLWRALNLPHLRSPLYRRAYYRQGSDEQLPPLRFPLIGLFKNLGLVVMPVIMILFAAPIAVLIFYLSLIVAPLLLPLANTVYGVMHVTSACGGIGKEREKQTYDVLCLSPQGILGMHWSYCVGWLHYHTYYRYLLIVTLLVGLISCVFGLGPQMIFLSSAPSIPVEFTRSLCLAAFFVVDYVQSIVVSSLTALLIPLYSVNQGDARAKASGAFLLLQGAVYLPTLLFGIYALPITLSLMGIAPALADLLIPILTLGFFIALRELIIAGLWHAIEQRMNTTTLELDSLSRLAL